MFRLDIPKIPIIAGVAPRSFACLGSKGIIMLTPSKS